MVQQLFDVEHGCKATREVLIAALEARNICSGYYYRRVRLTRK